MAVGNTGLNLLLQLLTTALSVQYLWTLATNCPSQCTCHFNTSSSKSKAVDCHGLPLNATSAVSDLLQQFPSDVSAISIRHARLRSLIDVCCFKHLQHLDLSFNHIDSILTAAEFPELVYLNLQNNRLKYLRTDEFTTFNQLEVLNLDNNEIETIALDTFRLFKLKELYLSNNRITRISDHVFRFTPLLERLDLAGNRITSVQTMFYFATRLKTINLGRNLIQQLEPDSLQNLQHLESLDLSFNNFSNPPMSELFQQSPTRLRILKLGGNPITYLREFAFQHTRVQHIDLSQSYHLRMVLARSFANSPILESVNLSSSSNLVFISPSAIAQSPTLRLLDLSNCRLQTIGADLLSLNRPLLRLNISGNPLLCSCLKDELMKTSSDSRKVLLPLNPACQRTETGERSEYLNSWADRNCPPHAITGDERASVGVVGSKHDLHCVARTPGDLVSWTLPSGAKLKPFHKYNSRIWMTQECLHFDFHRQSVIDREIYFPIVGYQSQDFLIRAAMDVSEDSPSNDNRQPRTRQKEDAENRQQRLQQMRTRSSKRLFDELDTTETPPQPEDVASDLIERLDIDTAAEAKRAANRERQRKWRESLTPENRLKRQQSIRECVSTSRQNASPEKSLKRRQTEQQRASTSRQSESPQKRLKRQQSNQECTSTARENESPETRSKRQQADQQRASTSRQSESPEKRFKRQQSNRECTSTARENASPEKRSKRQETERQRASTSRQNESAPETENRLENNRKRRLPSHNRRSKNVARHTSQILNGEKKVKYDDVGSLFSEDHRIVCTHCKAVKWKKEPPRMCCALGKVKQPAIFEDPPHDLAVLWDGDDEEALIFRKYIRPLNNALSLACLKVDEPSVPGRGWKPAVTIQGKVFMGMGPLEPTDDAAPVFAQLYVLDPTLATEEGTQRFRNMVLPSSATDHEKKVLKVLLMRLQNMLKRYNPYIKDFKCAHEIATADNAQHKQLVIDERKRPVGAHQRTFNPGFSEISVLMDDQNPGKRDFVIVPRGPGRQVKQIQDTHRSADPLHFILLLPRGEDGWNLATKQIHDNEHSKNCTPLQYYAYHLQMRQSPTGGLLHTLLRGCKAFHEYCCVNYAKVENQRLKYIANNQRELRGESYSRLAEDVHNHQLQGSDAPLRSGQPIILPPSFTGSPRYMHAHFQNATAILREYHKPDFFITFTCNPNWPEIVNSLLPGQTPQDRPDIVARVFRLKFDALMNELIKGEIFGRRAGSVHVIEFQKRGLPHAHILFIVVNDDRIDTSADVDTVISAELPPDPAAFPEGSEERLQAQKLQDAVLRNMIHSCSAACLGENGKCSKGFPKEFAEITEFNEHGFYPNYRRRKPDESLDDEVTKTQARSAEHKGKLVDNRWVVPYNPYLLLRFDAHINIELCASAKAAKYLFKYMNKGGDRNMASTDSDEVTCFQNLRCIGSSEACWRFFQFAISDNYPAVIPLRVHLENRQYTVFKEGDEAATVEQGPKPTELNQFFDYNSKHPNCRHRYVDFPKYFVWNETKREWTPRKLGIGRTIGRVHTIHPLSGDEFYLRILLNNDHSKGAISFEHLRTVANQVRETFKEACAILGLLRDDKEWDTVLTEAACTKFCKQLRLLFITLLLFCEPENPLALFENHVHQWCDDLQRRFQTASNEQLQMMVGLDIEEELQARGKELEDFNLPPIEPQNRLAIAQLQQQTPGENMSVAEQEELGFDLQQTIEERDEVYPRLTASQKAIYDRIVTAAKDGEPLALFINARGGTGKTFTLKGVLAAVRTLNDEKNAAKAVAGSVIAATLLPLGRTFHSRFKAPIEISEDMTLKVKPRDKVADVIRSAKVIVWDEAPMSHRFLLEALDRMLCDICENEDVFAGKVVVLAGDFRQVLPVIQYASRAQLTESSIKHSNVWNCFEVMTLNENLRVGSDEDRKEYDEWLQELGNGTLPIVEEPDFIQIPPEYTFAIDDESNDTVQASLLQFIDIIFPNLTNMMNMPPEERVQYIAERAILAPRNVDVDKINAIVTNQLPGQLVILTSADSTLEADDATRFPIEYLNSLTPAGLPPHQLFLKKGIILMLMRNISPRKGLCNGTRLILEKAHTLWLRCTIATGDHAGEEVFIPRVELSSNENEYTFKWRRRQFPVRPAFGITINKSQGQTLRTAGIWLQEPVFSHGQLYVAASRVGDPKHLHIAIPESNNGRTRNVVYKEALLYAKSLFFYSQTDSGDYQCLVGRRDAPEHSKIIKLSIVTPQIALEAVEISANFVSLAWNGSLAAESAQIDLWLMFYRKSTDQQTNELPRVVTMPKRRHWRNYRVRRLEPLTNYTFCLSYRYNAGNETLYESCTDVETSESSELDVTINLTALTTLLGLSALLCFMCSARCLHHRFYIWQEEKYRSQLQESISGQSFLSSADSLNVGGVSVTYENIPLSCSLYSSASSSRRTTPRNNIQPPNIVEEMANNAGPSTSSYADMAL